MSEAYSEPILAWRLWHVRLQGDEYRLESFTRHHVSWPAGRRLAASCPVHGENAPASGHECGIYAFTTRALAEDLLRRYTGVHQCYGRPYGGPPPPRQGRPTLLARPYGEPPPPRRGRPLALGRVSLWGRVLEREKGFRAKYAYPYELFLVGGDARIAGALRATYAVDVWHG